MIDFRSGAAAHKQIILQTWKYLHENAEISWEEANTTRYLQERLAGLGLRTITFTDCTGVIGEWGEAGPADLTVALRSDIDALWQYVDGKWRANHSCGHDAHMAMVLGAIEILKTSGYTPPGKIKVIFQPAEEKGEGALKLVEKGVVDDIDYLYGIHLRPIQEFPLGKASPAIYNGASMTIKGEIRGISAHGARPHLGVNVIEVASYIVQLLQSVRLNPMVPATVKMTRLVAGGDSANIIPDYAEFSIDARAQANDAIDELEGKIDQIIRNSGEAFGAQVSLTFKHKTAAAIVDERAKELLRESIAELLGEHNVSEIVTPGGEDFHFYPLKRPAIKATMLGLGCDLQPGLHHPHMKFHLSALYTGAEILARTIVRTFEKGVSSRG